MKIASAVSTFIDEKYIPLDKRYKLGIFVVLLLLPVLLFYFLSFRPGSKTINQLENQKTSLSQEVKKIEARVANRPKFLKELKETQSLFDQASKLLPKEKEIPNLLTNISDLGRGAGLDFLSFKPNPTVDKDFYTEIPVSITVNGPYHNVGLFFDQVSKLNRIVSITSVTMSNPQKDGPDMLLNSSCELKTYRFTDKKISKPKAKKGKK